MEESDFKKMMLDLQEKAQFIISESDVNNNVYCFKGCGCYDYISFENGVMIVDDSVNFNNFKIIDDPMRDYLVINLFANDFLIGELLISRKINDKTWYLEKMDNEEIISQLSKRCESFKTEFEHMAFPYHKWETVMFSDNGSGGVIAEINAVDRNGKCTYSKAYKPSTVIFGHNLALESSIYGNGYIDVWLEGSWEHEKIVKFTLKYKGDC